MAPRKKPSGVNNQESTKEYTPVKASTSCPDANTPAMCPTRGRMESQAIDESPSPGIFSPGNKPACDIEWAWKSPIGRLGSSGNTTKRRLINKTPVQKTKRCAKANSPLNHFPSKRKLIKSENIDSDHLTILTSQLQALKQCALDENKPDTSTTLSTLLAPTNNNKTIQDNSLKALLDDDNYFTLLQCSQYVEEKLIENPDKTAFSPIYLKSDAKKISRFNQTSTQKLSTASSTSLQTPVEKHTPIVKESHATSPKNQPTLLDTEENIVLLVDSSDYEKLVLATVESTLTKDLTKLAAVTQVKPSFEKQAAANKSYNTFADDSFDDVLANFCDENIELLSQGKTSSQQETPNNVLELSITSEEKRTNRPSSPEVNTFSISQEITRVTVENKSVRAAPCSTASYSFDDDFLQPDLLKMLDAIESSDLQRVPSPHQCTPEEIENKRLEAKMKLEKKKRATIVETNRLPSRSSFGNVRR